jgi:hypothetical protein
MNNYERELNQAAEELNNGEIDVKEYNKRIGDIEHQSSTPHKSDADYFEEDLNY